MWRKLSSTMASRSFYQLPRHEVLRGSPSDGVLRINGFRVIGISVFVLGWSNLARCEFPRTSNRDEHTLPKVHPFSHKEAPEDSRSLSQELPGRHHGPLQIGLLKHARHISTPHSTSSFGHLYLVYQPMCSVCNKSHPDLSQIRITKRDIGIIILGLYWGYLK